MSHALMAALIAMPRLADGRANKQAVIDAYCRQVRLQFQEMQPYYFSGPEPWAPLDELPPDFLDAAVATVYMDGARVQWLVLQMNGTGAGKSAEGWFETVSYYFDPEGNVAKRERHLEMAVANTVLDESRYYRKGKLWKNHLVHHALAKGGEDWSQLFDPEAPEYLNIRDLPFPAVLSHQRLAQIEPVIP